jgi:hypothetical protein
MSPTSNNPPRSASLPPGFDEKDPYSDADLSEYPDWWRQGIETFREYELRPYRPSRFSDDVIVHSLINKLEEKYGISIQIRSINPKKKKGWQVCINGDPVKSMDHTREPEGFSRYSIESDTFKSVIKSTVLNRD